MYAPTNPNKTHAVVARNVPADAPRDRSIALIAPAAAALCLALPRSDCYGGGGGGGDCCSVRATLYGVLADCMRGAVALLEMVLVGANRLGQAVSRERWGT